MKIRNIITITTLNNMKKKAGDCTPIKPDVFKKEEGKNAERRTIWNANVFK